MWLFAKFVLMVAMLVVFLAMVKIKNIVLRWKMEDVPFALASAVIWLIEMYIIIWCPKLLSKRSPFMGSYKDIILRKKAKINSKINSSIILIHMVWWWPLFLTCAILWMKKEKNSKPLKFNHSPTEQWLTILISWSLIRRIIGM